MEKSKTFGYRDLIVWQKAYKLTVEIYQLTKAFPNSENYSLVQQMRRSAVSIPSNIAEGYGRQHNKEYRQFLAVALGSLYELETQYLLSIDLSYAKSNEPIQNIMKEVGAMLYRMIHPIKDVHLSPNSSLLYARKFHES